MSDEAFKVDQFTVVTDIAPGQVSDVFEVVEDGTGRNLALKMLRREIVESAMEAPSKAIITQFKQEFKLGEILDHPNLIKVHDIKVKVQTLLPVKDPIAYFTMEYFRSQNLKSAMTADPTGTQRRIQRVLEQLCDALGYVHSKGWIHRDIKPDNILVTKTGEARLIDFSLACKVKKRSKTIQGTRTYIAPETIKKQKAVPQTDMYSIGVMLFEVLAGQPPFTGASPTDLLKNHLAVKPMPPSDFNPNVAPELDRLVAKLMAKKTTDRHESMEDLVADIRATRFFKEEIVEEVEDDGPSEEDLTSIVKTLDSRADAERSKVFAANPTMAAQYEADQKAQAERIAHKKALHAEKVKQSQKKGADPETAAPTPSPQPSPIAPTPQPMQPVMPMQPQMPMPGMMPGVPMAPPTGMPMAAPMMPMPGMPGAMPMPGMPGAPVPGMPGAPVPASPLPGGAPPAAGMPLPGGPAPTPSTPAPAGAPPAVQPPLPGQPTMPPANQAPPTTPPEDLPLMEELPEIE